MTHARCEILSRLNFRLFINRVGPSGPRRRRAQGTARVERGALLHWPRQLQDAHQLLAQGVSFKLREILLTDESGAPTPSRPHDQLHQILSLSNELLPPLPKGAGGKDAAGAAAASPCRAGRTAR